MSVKQEHQALIYVMVLMSAADSNMTDKELFTIGETVKTLPIFDGMDIETLPEHAERCADMLSKENGLDAVLRFVSGKLPARLHETAYALACDIAAVEGRLRSEEIKLLEFLRHKLEIGRLPAAAIERGAKARYQVL
ncbi:MAG: tellurite resistance TerB family protein [Proteobacteria bacterium]|nr:tellurite resistance TerB family protein [Pseudomonadota bacterium]